VRHPEIHKHQKAVPPAAAILYRKSLEEENVKFTTTQSLSHPPF